MVRDVAQAAKKLIEQLKVISGIEAITLHESAEISPDDPYFYLSLDVYYRGSLPDPQVRKDIFSGLGAFESSAYAMKDRFFIDTLPVRIEYKYIDFINRLLRSPDENLAAFRDSGTYTFYRLRYGRIIFQEGVWLDEVRGQLDRIPASFWTQLSEAHRARAEHHLADLGSAVVRGDSLFYVISLAGFIRRICSFLLAVNHRFEPSPRQLGEQVLTLPVLPENFRGRFDSLMRDDVEFGPERKREVAELLTRSILLMHG
ncbi:DUF4037 domain-containing protein [Sediminispirochaeta bajacaliforniensis]|uniref:DUF4037 domain-containing protein n=1 Tax=Sediminispirochaeta bajacaliforniensis TaxID=148 RepID=UPI00036DE718|nr:DUF4037 domain-containing protein [Sediminispirochaeta bajacaliforniensis]